jgi:hypothetical protein
MVENSLTNRSDSRTNRADDDRLLYLFSRQHITTYTYHYERQFGKFLACSRC